MVDAAIAILKLISALSDIPDDDLATVKSVYSWRR
jgi:hypothetical protein